MRLSNPLGKVVFQGRKEAYYLKMYKALKIGIDVESFKKMGDEEIDLLWTIYIEESNRAERAAEIEAARRDAKAQANRR